MITHFNWFQLCPLYAAIDLEGQLKPMQDKLAFMMGHKKNGHSCCYQIHPEKVFFFTFCRLRTGFMQVHIMDNYIG